MTSLTRVAALLACWALLGCTTPNLRQGPSLRGAPVDSITESVLRRNAAIHAGRHEGFSESEPGGPVFPFRLERDWFGAEREKGPRLCVSLSGGGMRSGTFSVGILRGLAEIGLLDKVQVLSAVSGGAYAATGLYAQFHHKSVGGTPVVVNKLMDDGYIRQVMARGRLFRETEWLGLALASFAAAPLNLWENGVFEWHTNTSTVANEYRRRIKWAFHAAPDSKPYHPGTTQRIYPEEILFSAFAAARSGESGQLPFLIVNGTSQFHKSTTSSLVLADRVFEFTPLFYGSDALGRHKLSPGAAGVKRIWEPGNESPAPEELKSFFFEQFPSLSLAAAISGAAVDWSGFTSDLLRVPLSASNIDLGWFLQNPTDRIEEKDRERYRRLIFPFYFADPLFYNDMDGMSWYVTDGGHSENLGAYSLIRRGCENIVVIDAEQDPEYEFGAYFTLREALRKDGMNVTLNVSAIEEVGAAHARITNAADKRALIDRLKSEFGRYPLRFGSVGMFPVPDSDYSHDAFHRDRKIKWKELKIAYIKLANYEPNEARCAELLGSATEKDLNDLEDDPSGLREKDLVEFYHCRISRQNRQVLRQARGLEDFPQQVTSDVNYSPMQVGAYVCLGLRVVKRHERPLTDLIGPSASNIETYQKQMAAALSNPGVQAAPASAPCEWKSMER